jgi:hypothetical protein
MGVACAALSSRGERGPNAPYTGAFHSSTVDTTRAKASRRVSEALHERGAVIRGYLSSWGLPPLPAEFSISDTGLVLRSTNGSISARAATLSLAYIEDGNGRAHYLFRIDSGVFETEAPGPLLEVATHPRWLTSPHPAGRATLRMLVDETDPAAPLQATRQIGSSPYADSLYRLFGQPRAPLGLIGRRGRAAGRLGEYIAARDSLALDPGHMTSQAQLRHALAHELGHRWQVRAKAQLAALWSGVPGIRDPKRYGYDDRSEHQAEAVAFAISFLQTTAAGTTPPSTSITLLDHYELLVPGTRTLVRYLLLQPVYRDHPLRSLLTTTRPTYALEK